MRILLSLTYFLPHVSGITVYNYRLAKELAASGHTVTVLTSRYRTDLPARETMDGFRVVRLPVAFWISKGAIMPGFPAALARELARHDVLLMNLPNTPVEALAGPLLARAMGKPLVAKHMCDVELPPGPFHHDIPLHKDPHPDPNKVHGFVVRWELRANGRTWHSPVSALRY